MLGVAGLGRYKPARDVVIAPVLAGKIVCSQQRTYRQANMNHNQPNLGIVHRQGAHTLRYQKHHNTQDESFSC